MAEEPEETAEETPEEEEDSGTKRIRNTIAPAGSMSSRFVGTTDRPGFRDSPNSGSKAVRKKKKKKKKNR